MVELIQTFFTESAKPFFNAISDLGTGAPFVVMLLSLFLLFGTKTGLRAGLLFSAASYCTFLLKWLIAAPRPYFIAPNVTAHSLSSGYGMPSGHAAQTSAGLWPALAHTRRSSVAPLLVAFVLLVAVSRIYLGVHFVGQVLAGLALGTALFVLASAVEDRLVAFLKARTLPVQTILVFAPLVALILLDRAWISAVPVDIPSEWQIGYDRAIEARAAELGIDPDSAEVTRRKQEFTLVEPRRAEFYSALMGWLAVGLVALRRGVYQVTGVRHALANLTVGGLIVGGLFAVFFGLLDIDVVQWLAIAAAPLICAYLVPCIVEKRLAGLSRPGQ